MNFPKSSLKSSIDSFNPEKYIQEKNNRPDNVYMKLNGYCKLIEVLNH
jgi:hypothetical protein